MKDIDLNFEYIEDFADYIVTRVENCEELFLTVVGKFEEIKNIVKEMMSITNVDFEKIELCSEDMCGYKDEYVLDCWYDDDGVVQIGCMPAKKDGEYTKLVGDETYLFDNVSSKIIPLCKGTDLYYVSIDEECDCDDECGFECPCDCHVNECCVECSESENGDIHGFTASKSTENGYHSYSFYTSDNLSKDEISSILKELGF